ncbi:hypothetical protein TPA0598_01_06820 [Streptomyces lydicamycinicus]|uniref:Integral membrane protein n=1 Tax=Streptomyces lydicamycinicus TaxID=1546107 RepID=A0A0P4R1M7_9ACTN|nr:hypothetical protein TPA0598_01_06820 [Streptomyces lydicamycinicus]
MQQRTYLRVPASRPVRLRGIPGGRDGRRYPAGVSSQQKQSASRAAGAPTATASTVPTGPRPARLSAAAALTAVEGLALAALGGYMLIMGLAGSPDSPQQAEMGGLTVLALAVLPLVAARGLWLRRRWSRGPSLITQIVALPVAWTLVNGGGALIAAGIGLAVAALVVLVLLVNPTATEALGIGPRETP